MIATVEEYLANLSEIRRVKVSKVIDFLREKYPNYEESLYYSRQNAFPVYKSPDGRYVGVADRKKYISIYFTSRMSVDTVAAASSKIKQGVGCVNIPDSIELPIEEIEKAIIVCFEGPWKVHPCDRIERRTRGT